MIESRVVRGFVCSSLTANPPKGEIDPRTAGTLFFFNSMFPTVLRVAFHQKEAARGKF
jgi:hypothetical protein